MPPEQDQDTNQDADQNGRSHKLDKAREIGSVAILNFLMQPLKTEHCEEVERFHVPGSRAHT